MADDIRSIINSIANIDITTSATSQNADVKSQTAVLNGISGKLDNIKNILSDLSSNGTLGSQSAGRDAFRQNYREYYGDNIQNIRNTGRNGYNRDQLRDRLRDQYDDSDYYNSRNNRNRRRRRRNEGPEGFIDNFEASLFEGFFGNDGNTFRRDVNQIFQRFADKLNVNISELPDAIGRQAGRNFIQSRLANSENLRTAAAVGREFRDTALNALSTHGNNALDALLHGDNAKAITELKTMGSTILKSGGSFVNSLVRATPQILGHVAVLKLATTALNGLVNIMNAAVKAFENVRAAANRDVQSRKKNLELAEKRMQEDYKVLIEEPFKILKEAAQDVINSWNQNLTTVAATQGYTKSDVQDLMSVLAQRLQSEGLSDYISGSDIFDNIAKVLSDGLSGPIAEEFAYQATVLNKAIPTQDFFSYASTYASVAANAIRTGQSQNQAIQTANKSLQDFASGLLYASRELSGGFSTGLKNASSIYEQSAKIAQAARSENMSAISGVLLAAQSYIGAVAPDLASGIVDTIYKALVGGNASDIVALRSLAGVNASNTEFLREFADNPQKIFANLFENLAKMYNDSSDAYMEKAEGYAQLFGLSTEAFQRVDFRELATAIRNMNMTSSSLDENLSLLAQGETTTTAEQLKAQQINKYMLEEGLSYVIDNEAAQLIQQHMWDEQIARELMEKDYSVKLAQGNMDVFLAIKETVNSILNFLNPFAWLKKVFNLSNTSAEQRALNADVAQILELGKVGQGNMTARNQLLTRNANLNVVSSMVELLGGQSMYNTARQRTEEFKQISNAGFGTPTTNRIATLALEGRQQDTTSSRLAIQSQYNWGNISKSQGKSATELLKSITTNIVDDVVSVVSTESGTAVSASAETIKSRIQNMLSDSYIGEFVNQHKTYEDWAASASKFGISDITEALETAGYREADIQNYFQSKETEAGLQEQHAIEEQKKLFRETGMAFWKEEFPNNYQVPLFEKVDTTNDWLRQIHESLEDHIYDVLSNKIWGDETHGLAAFSTDYQTNTKAWLTEDWAAFMSTQGNSGLFNQFYSQFMDYFVKHTYYDQTSGYNYQDVERVQTIQKDAERGNTVTALAEMLTSNFMDLRDPTMQTNALLAQILLVIQAIKQQNDTVPGTGEGSSIIDQLQALALGLTDSVVTGATAGAAAIAQSNKGTII